jgi:hypothetical protein
MKSLITSGKDECALAAAPRGAGLPAGRVSCRSSVPSYTGVLATPYPRPPYLNTTKPVRPGSAPSAAGARKARGGPQPTGQPEKSTHGRLWANTGPSNRRATPAPEGPSRLCGPIPYYYTDGYLAGLMTEFGIISLSHRRLRHDGPIDWRLNHLAEAHN